MKMPTADYLHLPLAEMEARVQRFEQRVNASLQAAPPTRDWVRRALRRQGAARCPVRLKRLSYDIIVRHGDALADLFTQFPDDALLVAPYEIALGMRPPDRTDWPTPVQALMQAAQWTDEWGITWAHAFGGVGATSVASPLTDWSQLDEYLAARVPDPEAGRFDGLRPSVGLHGGNKYVVGTIHLALFERMYMLRGMENLLADLYAHPREVRRLAEAVTPYTLGMVRGVAEAGMDAVFMTDDWGTQQSMMIAPDMWRAFFAPHYRAIFAEAHRCGLDVIFHSCGNVTAIIPDLIELGVDVIDPLQPEAMDLKKIAREFGGKVAFSGGISDQELVAYTPTQVRDHVRRTLDTLGKASGKAYLVAPANILPPDVPLANLRALFEACHDQ